MRPRACASLRLWCPRILLLSVLLCADIFCSVSFLWRDGCFWVRRRPKLRWILLVQAVALVISVACCIFVVATLESSVAPVPRALMRCDVKRRFHRASCFAVALVGPVPLLGLAVGVPRRTRCCPQRSPFKNHSLTEDGSWDAGSRSPLMLLLRPASLCCLVREKHVRVLLRTRGH